MGVGFPGEFSGRVFRAGLNSGQGFPGRLSGWVCRADFQLVFVQTGRTIRREPAACVHQFTHMAAQKESNKQSDTLLSVKMRGEETKKHRIAMLGITMPPIVEMR